MGASPAGMSVCHVNGVPVLWSEEAIRHPGTESQKLVSCRVGAGNGAQVSSAPTSPASIDLYNSIYKI